MIGNKESDVSSIRENIYTRCEAERVLFSNIKRSLFIDPLSLPIAGLRSISSDEIHTSLNSVPREILLFEHKPILLFDLDEVMWPHIYDSVVVAVGEATGKRISRDRYRTIGNTRCIPEWKDDAEIMKIHDSIVRGEHPEYYPYVNIADPKAIATLHAVKSMGHTFSYLTSRPSTVLRDTLRVIGWNGMPMDENQRDFVDAFEHDKPKNGYVYGGNGIPMMEGRKGEHKREIVDHWLKNLRAEGWKGQMVFIDDLLYPFEKLIEERNMLGIALRGDVNASRKPIKGEVRVDSWLDISSMLMEVHKRAVASDSSPYRIFEYQGKKLIVDKNQAGVGVFSLRTIPRSAWRWEDVDMESDVQKDFGRISS